MFVKINEEEFELNTKLGTTFKIEEKFKKPYLKVLSEMENLTAKEQINLLICGLSGQDEISRFKKAVEECGLGELSEILEEYIDSLQYPGLTAEEIEEKKLAKLEKQKHYKEIGLIK